MIKKKRKIREIFVKIKYVWEKYYEKSFGIVYEQNKYAHITLRNYCIHAKCADGFRNT
jgi:hypothetical protein